MPTTPEIEALIAAGKYQEAARELRVVGDLARAQAMFEKVWDFVAAAEVAAERGDKAEWLRLLLEAKDLVAAGQVGEALRRGTTVEQERAAVVYEKRRMWAEAAALWEATGAREKARDLFRKAHQPLEVARLDEALGRRREAGLAYERFLADEPDSADAPRAAAALGRLLGGFGRHEEAVRALQRAARAVSRTVDAAAASTLALEVRRALVPELAALGLTLAARHLLDELRQTDPTLPPLDAFLTRHAQTRAPGGDGDSAELLGGRYQILRLLGSGGMGRVYLGRDRFANRDVAVKIVAPPSEARARQSYERFVREARIVSGLRHPNVVAVTDFHEELGLLVMEYMAGGTLADRLRPALSPTVARLVLGQVIAGLQAAHVHGVIHRDIKPPNIFFTRSSEAKLGDFGVAHLQDLGATQTGGFIGTLAYMSPEQITGAPLSFACDVYALGVTTFQMLTGKLPFNGPDFVGQHLGVPPPRVSSLRPEVAPFDLLVARMLAKDPAERFSTLDELARAVAEIKLADASGPTATAATATATGAEVEPDQPEPAAATEERYRVEAEVGTTAVSRLERGIDQRLGRVVILERFEPGFLDGEAGARHLAWLRAMARHGGPHLQRVLRIERALGRVVYEAPVGPPPGALDARAARRLLTDVAAALAGPHGEGVAHGAVASGLVMEESGATLLVAGHGRSEATPADDVAALLALARRLGGDAELSFALPSAEGDGEGRGAFRASDEQG